MAFTIPVNDKDLEIKFDFGLMFKVNKELASRDENGNKQENGAGQLFINITERADSALINLIKIAHGKKNLTDEKVIEAISDYAEEHGYIEMYEEVEKELLDSGFFAPKIQKTMEDMKFGKQLLEESNDPEQQNQAKAIQSVITRLEKKISSHNAQK